MQDHKKQVNLIENIELPIIPDKLYFTIGEVAKLCDLKTHVLRYWEQEFEQLSPSKRRGNRRYYQRKDVLLIRQIKTLLYNDGFTIEGARAKLGNEKVQTTSTQVNTDLIHRVIKELEKLQHELES
jgi:DNA-binding transcriptional MerR regulator